MAKTAILNGGKLLFNERYGVYVDTPHASKILAIYFAHILNEQCAGREKVLLCIGTDRSTGDSLGPFVGEILAEKGIDVPIYGTLEKPVHAANLQEVVGRIKDGYKAPFIIAIDAALGKAEEVGVIKIGPQPIKPGSGLKKDLPEVGDMSITGIVNMGGFLEMQVIQCTRLYLVIKMANVIADGIAEGLRLANQTTFCREGGGQAAEAP